MDKELKKLPLAEYRYFPSCVYTVDMKDFLDDLTEISKEYLDKSKEHYEMNQIYPVLLSQNFVNDERIKSVIDFIEYSSLNILNSQGYDVTHFGANINAFWAQKHFEYSGQEHHYHSNNQIVGFYFLEVPEESCGITFHDINNSRHIMALPEESPWNATPASSMITFQPKVGQMMFSNAWLPHSFSRNQSKEPFTFIHFNINTYYEENKNAKPSCEPENPDSKSFAEVI